MLTKPAHIKPSFCYSSGTGKYRYGFQGQEKDDEISGRANHYTSSYWEYDPRIGPGGRWNIDPVIKPWESLYTVFANNPIWFADPTGADSVKVSASGGPAKFDPTKDTGVLEEFTIEDEDPTKVPMDNTSVDVHIDPRSRKEQIASHNAAVIQSHIDHNDKFTGFLLGNDSPLSPDEKVGLISYKMHSGRGAQFFKIFGLSAVGAAGLGAVSSYGLLGGFGLSGSSSGFRISSLLATNLGRVNLGFGVGSALSNLGVQLAFNDGDIGGVNYISVISSGLFKHPFTASFAGSGFGATLNKGYQGFGERPILAIGTEIGIGTVASYGFNSAHNYLGFKTNIGSFGFSTTVGTQFNMLNIGISKAATEQNNLDRK